MKAQGNLYFDECIAEVGAIQIWWSSNQTEYGVIYQLCLTNSFFPINFYLSRNTT